MIFEKAQASCVMGSSNRPSEDQALRAANASAPLQSHLAAHDARSNGSQTPRRSADAAFHHFAFSVYQHQVRNADWLKCTPNGFTQK